MPTYPLQYYSRFDAQKRYKQLLFRAARGLQSAELNEIAATLHFEMQTLADVTFGDGSLLKGGSIARANADSAVWTAQESLFYARGYTHVVPGLEFVISPLETTSFGVALREDVVSEDDDASLRDPAINTRNFNEPGAHRLRMTARWCKEGDKAIDEQYYVITQFTDGSRNVPVAAVPELAATKDMIARFDYNSNGSYVVRGLQTTYFGDDGTDHVLSISEGQGNVEGYEQVLQYAQRVRVPFAMDTRTIENEPLTFSAAGDYAMRWSPIAEVNEVNGIVEITKTITHGNFTGAMDLLPNAPVVSISSVTQGATTYVQGTSWTQSGDYIDWAPGGPEPAPGSTYVVVFRYSAVKVATISADRKKINISGFAPGTIFYVDYKQYIPRYDILTLSKAGELKVVKGVPDFINPTVPAATFGLQLATVYVRFGDLPKITIDALRAFRMSDIRAMNAKIEDVNYNVARLSLAERIRVSDPTTAFRGYFVDAFHDDALRDAGIVQNCLVAGETLMCDTAWNVQAVRQGARIMMPFTEEITLNQPYHTKSRQIHAYASILPPPAVMAISPQTYRWYSRLDAVTIATTSWSSLGYLKRVETSSYVTEALDAVVRPLPTIGIFISASLFNGNEPVDVFFDSVFIKTVNADANGLLSTTLTTPAWATSGSKQIRVVGKITKVEGIQVFTGQPIVRTTTTRVDTYFYDPLAQTFVLPKDQFLSSVNLQFAVNTPSYVDVFLSEVALGIPDRTKIFARKRVLPGQINPSATGGVWTNVAFPQPVRVLAGQEYAVILASPEPVSAIRTAEIGGYDPINKRWISTQANEEGVLLESANLSSWTAVPKEDMTFQLKKAIFPTTSTFTFNPITVTQATDLVLLAGTDLMAGTSVQFVATLIDRGNEERVISPYEPIIIDEYTGAIRLRAMMTTNNPDITPQIDGDVSLAVGSILLPSTYVSRAIVIPSGTANFKAYLEINEAQGSNVIVEYRNQADTAWVALTRDVSKAVNLGSNWVEMPFNAVGGVGGITLTRIRISLNTGDKTKRAYAANLRFFFS